MTLYQNNRYREILGLAIAVFDSSVQFHFIILSKYSVITLAQK